MLDLLESLEKADFFEYAKPTDAVRGLFGSDRARGRITVERDGHSVTLLSMRGLGLRPETKEIPGIYAEGKQAIQVLKNRASTLAVTNVRVTGRAPASVGETAEPPAPQVREVSAAGPPVTPFAVVVPARIGSTRLPEKPLLRETGKYLVEHVVERARRAAGVVRVVVATDDARIEAAVRSFGGEAMRTDPAHESGTARCAEVAARTRRARGGQRPGRRARVRARRPRAPRGGRRAPGRRRRDARPPDRRSRRGGARRAS